MKGLILSIYRDAGSDYDCTIGGASSTHTRAIVVGDDVPGIFEAKPGEAVFKLVAGNLRGTAKLVQIEPPPRKGVGPMFGGNYGRCGDGRFGQAICKLTGRAYEEGILPIHDRFE